MSLTNYLENALLNHLRGGTAFSQPSSLWVRLHTGDPGEDATSNGATESGRRQVTFGAASSGSMAATGSPVAEWTNVAATETYTHFSVWDASTSGNPLGKGALSSSAAVNAGDTFRLSSLTWALD